MYEPPRSERCCVHSRFGSFSSRSARSAAATSLAANGPASRHTDAPGSTVTVARARRALRSGGLQRRAGRARRDQLHRIGTHLALHALGFALAGQRKERQPVERPGQHQQVGRDQRDQHRTHHAARHHACGSAGRTLTSPAPTLRSAPSTRTSSAPAASMPSATPLGRSSSVVVIVRPARWSRRSKALAKRREAVALKQQHGLDPRPRDALQRARRVDAGHQLLQAREAGADAR